MWKEPVMYTKCPLLELPLEIRQKIFAEAIGNSVLHLVQVRKRLGHIRCTSPNRNDDLKPTCFSACFSPVPFYSYGMDIDPNQRSDGCLAFLQLTNMQTDLYRIHRSPLQHQYLRRKPRSNTPLSRTHHPTQTFGGY